VSNNKPFVKSNLLRYKSHNTISISKQFIRNNVQQGECLSQSLQIWTWPSTQITLFERTRQSAWLDAVTTPLIRSEWILVYCGWRRKKKPPVFKTVELIRAQRFWEVVYFTAYYAMGNYASCHIAVVLDSWCDPRLWVRFVMKGALSMGLCSASNLTSNTHVTPLPRLV